MKSWERKCGRFSRTKFPQVWQVWRQLMERYLNTETAFDPLNACNFDGIWLDQTEKCVTYIQNKYIYISYIYVYVQVLYTLLLLHICKHHTHYLHYIIIYLHSMHIFFNTFLFFLEHRGIHGFPWPQGIDLPLSLREFRIAAGFLDGSFTLRELFLFRRKPLVAWQRGARFWFCVPQMLVHPNSCVAFFKNWESHHLKEQWFYLVPRSSNRCWIFLP